MSLKYEPGSEPLHRGENYQQKTSARVCDEMKDAKRVASWVEEVRPPNIGPRL